MRHIPIDRLRKVWNHPRWTVEECAAILLITEEELRRLAKRHRLRYRRIIPSAEKYRADDEPCPAVQAELEQRKRECREAHMRQRLGEPATSTVNKVSKWRRGVSTPSAGRHLHD